MTRRATLLLARMPGIESTTVPSRSNNIERGGEVAMGQLSYRRFAFHPFGAVLFCCSLLHEATPVIRGRRHAFLPFSYDEVGRSDRQENLTRFAGTAATHDG